jgi:hypothetical protein
MLMLTRTTPSGPNLAHRLHPIDGRTWRMDENNENICFPYLFVGKSHNENGRVNFNVLRIQVGLRANG